MAIVNGRICLDSRPVGFPTLANFRLQYAPLPSPAAGEVLVRSVFLSLEPELQGRIAGAGSLGPPIGIGEVMPGGAVGVVAESGDSRFVPGDAVEGLLGWQEYALARGGDVWPLARGPTPPSTALGVLGKPGLTAYFGIHEIARPKPGETVVVSGADGGIGMVAGQLARIAGGRVVGVAASAASASWLLDELGFDAACHDRTPEDLEVRLAELCPAGIDVSFETSGGPPAEAVLRRMNDGARIIGCGPPWPDPAETIGSGPRRLDRLAARRVRFERVAVDHWSDRFPEGRAALVRWLESGELRYREDVARGIESAPQAFLGMLRGQSRGQPLVQLAEWEPGGVTG